MRREQWRRRIALGAGLLVLAGVAGFYLEATGASGPGVKAPPALGLGSVHACRAYAGVPAGWRQAPHAGEVYVAGGIVTIGSDAGYQDERPRVRRTLAPFWIDATEVTNAQFAAFVGATGYVTDAERQGGGVVFRAPILGGDGSANTGWWKFAPGASWRHPEGEGSSIEGAENLPVVQVTRADALAYAAWLGRTLPSEAQWEAAARAGRDNAKLDRTPLDAAGRPAANFWQGNFPFENTGSDGFNSRAPVGCFAANPYGLHDMIGNVWEWTGDAYSGPHQAHGHGEAAAARPAASGAPAGFAVIKGGSFLCAANYCVRYRAAARHPHEVDLPAAHVGFRTVRAAV
jgi:formylglycine-generating enzyme required for sulfatase activity